jgi:hypothetical protein
MTALDEKSALWVSATHPFEGNLLDCFLVIVLNGGSMLFGKKMSKTRRQQ